MNPLNAVRPALLGASYLALHIAAEAAFGGNAGTAGLGVWLPSGLALALLVVGGSAFAPLVAVALFGSSLLFLPAGAGAFRFLWPLLLVFCIWGQALLLRRWLGRELAIAGLRELGVFVSLCVAAAFGLAVSGSMGLLASPGDGGLSASALFNSLLKVQLLGFLVGAPPFIFLVGRIDAWRSRSLRPVEEDAGQPSWLENAAQVLALGLCLVLSGFHPEGTWVLLAGLPVLLWIGLRHGLLGSSFASLALVAATQYQLQEALMDQEHRRVLVLHLGVVIAFGLIAGTLGAAQRLLVTQLRDKQTRLATLFKGSSLGLWEWHPDGTMHFDAQWLALFGYGEADLAGKEAAWRKLVHPSDLSHVLWLRDAHAKGHAELFEAEYRIRCKDGSQRWVLDRGCVVERDGAGKPLRMAGACFDISARKQTEEDLQRIVQVVDQAADYVGAADMQGKVFYANQALMRLRNDVDLRSVQRRHVSEYYPDDQARRLLQQDLPAALAQGSFLCETELDDVSGRRIPVSQQLVVYRDAGGQPCAFSFIARDIAKARLAAAAERNALASDFQARKHESLERLSGGVAHQFNNLLTAVIGNTSLARIDVPQESGVHARLIASERAAMKAAELCKSLLLFSGGGRPPLGEASLNAIILAAEPGLQALGGSRVSVICSLDPGLGAVSANAQKIELALRELVRNAIESYGGRAGTVYLRTTRQQPEASLLRTPFHASEFKLVECAVIEIRDEGAGMSATTQERLFEPFFSTKHGHNGLGLSVVLGVVRSHGGAVEALSEPGRGTCFRLYFPIPSERQFAAPSEAAPEPKAEEWRNSGQVLVVDDEESVRVVATYMLESLGFTPFVAKDGMEGVKLFRQHNPSLRAVLLDLSMPMMDGEEAFGEMRRINADTPILIMSGYSQKEMTVRFKGCDPAGFLNKPFTFEDLRGAMRRALVREGPSRGADSR